jgi:hypothetical protein
MDKEKMREGQKSNVNLGKTVISLALEQKFLLNSLRVLRTSLTQAYTTRNSEEKLKIINHSINHINNVLAMDDFKKDMQYKKLHETRIKDIVGETK